MAFRFPLSSIVKFRSHWATGKTNDIDVVSNIDDQQVGMAIRRRRRLNLPNPVATRADSKSATAGSSTANIEYTHTHENCNYT